MKNWVAYKKLVLLLYRFIVSIFDYEHVTAQKMKFSIKDFFRKCDIHINWRNP